MVTAATSLLDAETFSVSSQHDALGRVLTAVSPDGSEVHYSYDEGGGLQTVTLNHRGSVSEETVVGDITYDAQGRREKVVHGSSSSPTTTTSYTYDPIAQRLTRLRTVRHSDDAAIQSLHYHYDPVGNITDIRDTAQQTVYFQNSVVAAANSYEYDALYRLVEASGREHSTQGTAQRTHEQLPIGAQPMTSDPSAMRRYTQKFSYDGVGNILKMQHLPDGGTGWTRHYEYDTDGNRLLATSAPGDDAEGPYTHTYSYDAHGSMTVMPHLSSMVWNHDDELEEVTAGSETVYFQYAGGIRSRKFTEKSGTVTEERIYLGPFEIYRKRVNGDLDLERESLHISDGSGRICIVETKTVEDEDPVGSPTGIWRYQHGNHLGSAATEVDGNGAIISYEEYHPYGTSAYRAVNSSIEVSAKRYRYTGMEQDEETGLAYHSARYYANWLGRWTASDPIGLAGGGNRFAYTSNPIISSDTAGLSPKSFDEPAHYGADRRSSGGAVPYVDPPLTPGEIVFEDDHAVSGQGYGAAHLPQAKIYNNDPDFAFFSLAVPNAHPESLVVDQIAERSAWQAEWSEAKMVRRMNDGRNMAVGFMAAYLGSAVALAVAGEAYAVYATVLATGAPGVGLGLRISYAASEAGSYVATGVSAYASTNVVTMGAVALGESFLMADAAAHGVPIDLLSTAPAAGQLSRPSPRVPNFETSARFANQFPGDTQIPGRVVRLELELNGRWYEYGAGAPARRRAQGTYDFVVMNGQTLAVRQPSQMTSVRPGHLTLSGGGSVEFAGQVRFGGSSGRGHVRSWNNASGHYKPHPFYSPNAPFAGHLFTPAKFDTLPVHPVPH